MSIQLYQEVSFELSMLWVFVQPESMMNADIRKNGKCTVFFIKERLPVIMESKMH